MWYIQHDLKVYVMDMHRIVICLTDHTMLLVVAKLASQD